MLVTDEQGNVLSEHLLSQQDRLTNGPEEKPKKPFVPIVPPEAWEGVSIRSGDVWISGPAPVPEK